MEQQIITQLAQHLVLFRQLFADVPQDMIHWKKDDHQWCLLEIVCHLKDIEKEDFGYRTKHCLMTPEKPFPPIFPVKWVKERKYIEQDFTATVNAFLKERQHSINWLQALEKPNWQSAVEHPDFGPQSARFYLTNWLAHDHLHIRQITRTKYQYLADKGGYPLNYAGKW